MAHRYEFTFDRHSELSHEVIKNIKDYLNNLTDGRVAWNVWSIPDEMALYNLEQESGEESEYETEFSREPVASLPPLEEIRQASELFRIGYVEAPSVIAPGQIIGMEDF